MEFQDAIDYLAKIRKREIEIEFTELWLNVFKELSKSRNRILDAEHIIHLFEDRLYHLRNTGYDR